RQRSAIAPVLPVEEPQPALVWSLVAGRDALQVQLEEGLLIDFEQLGAASTAFGEGRPIGDNQLARRVESCRVVNPRPFRRIVGLAQIRQSKQMTQSGHAP